MQATNIASYVSSVPEVVYYTQPTVSAYNALTGVATVTVGTQSSGSRTTVMNGKLIVLWISLFYLNNQS